MVSRSSSITSLFNSIRSLRDIKKLIYDGEAEGQYLECKSPRSPQELDRSLKAELAKEISGFANSGGGIIIFGVSTDHKSGGLDVLTDIEYIGLIDEFVKKLEVTVPLLTYPRAEVEIKTIKQKKSATKGITIVMIPGTEGDPVAAQDKLFYLRIGDKTQEMPYETIKRMFLGTANPDLYVLFDPRLIKQDRKEGTWRIPIVLSNRSSSPGKSVTVSIVFENPSSCENVVPESFRDVSEINPGKKIYMAESERPVHKELNLIIGSFTVKMKPRVRSLKLRAGIYAENMRAKDQRFKIHLVRRGSFEVIESEEKFKY